MPPSIGKFAHALFFQSVLGIIAILAFKPLFTQGTFAPKPPPTITLGCDMDGSYLTEFADGSVACSMANSTSTATHFIIEDLTGSFVRTSGSIASSISLSDTVYDGVFTKLFADNAFFAFTVSSLVRRSLAMASRSIANTFLGFEFCSCGLHGDSPRCRSLKRTV